MFPGLTKQDALSILITMVAGFIVGMYLYVMGFAPQVEKVTQQFEPGPPAWVIVGEAYGGIRAVSAPAFRIEADGSYRYLPPAPIGELAEPQTGTLPRGWQRPLESFLTADTLATLAVPREADDCASFVDGLDYTYDITFDGTEYNLDTCYTALADNAALVATLADLWNYFVVEN
jgi:hypothetical protein